MKREGIDYDRLVREALLGVVRQVLEQVVAQGLPGEQHLFITFRTDHPEADVPAALRRKHPEEMTIVIQHQFWNLVVEEQRFSVTLRFGGAPQRLSVPWSALVAVVDPSVPFGLRFGDPSEPEVAAADVHKTEVPRADAASAGERPAGANVVEISAFRRRD